MATRGKTLMVQGTASSVGKSLLVTALCRHFSRAGIAVAPFKAQNMSLNSAVTPDGREIGRAQAVQAEACGIAPRVEMNPILLKPEAGGGAHVVVMGKALRATDASAYYEHREALQGIIADCLETLRSEYDLVVIEGAGSPAEVNLKDRDLVNMHVARVADAPVLLVGDIDRGGVFAALVGTLELLEPDERARVAALVINKFHGDVSLLQSGLTFLEARTGKPVLGVVPYVQDLRIADEDSVALDQRPSGTAVVRAVEDDDHDGRLDVAVVRLPHISNHDDVLPLERDPRVVVRFVQRIDELGSPDLLVLPGSKCTVHDLQWLRQTGFADALAARAGRREAILGICGGCQMLGESIDDPEGVESSVRAAPGLALLPLRTHFEATKRTTDVRARVGRRSWLTAGIEQDVELSGYEIHMGRVEQTGEVGETFAAFIVTSRNGEPANGADGACDGSGAVVGTMIHGLLDNDAVRASLISSLGGGGLSHAEARSNAAEFDRLEQAVIGALDVDALWRLAGLRRATT